VATRLVIPSQPGKNFRVNRMAGADQDALSAERAALQSQAQPGGALVHRKSRSLR
jgi:hypothetical protein